MTVQISRLLNSIIHNKEKFSDYQNPSLEITEQKLCHNTTGERTPSTSTTSAAPGAAEYSPPGSFTPILDQMTSSFEVPLVISFGESQPFQKILRILSAILWKGSLQATVWLLTFHFNAEYGPASLTQYFPPRTVNTTFMSSYKGLVGLVRSSFSITNNEAADYRK